MIQNIYSLYYFSITCILISFIYYRNVVKYIKSLFALDFVYFSLRLLILTFLEKTVWNFEGVQHC